jgi:hypothetical protein
MTNGIPREARSDATRGARRCDALRCDALRCDAQRYRDAGRAEVDPVRRAR